MTHADSCLSLDGLFTLSANAGQIHFLLFPNLESDIAYPHLMKHEQAVLLQYAWLVMYSIILLNPFLSRMDVRQISPRAMTQWVYDHDNQFGAISAIDESASVAVLLYALRLQCVTCLQTTKMSQDGNQK
jgi:hypothetical protein